MCGLCGRLFDIGMYNGMIAPLVGEDAKQESVRAPKAPHLLSILEQEEHRLLHWLFRNWCTHRAKGRGLV